MKLKENDTKNNKKYRQSLNVNKLLPKQKDTLKELFNLKTKPKLNT